MPQIMFPDPQQLSTKPPDNLNVLIYGKSGTGKTVFAAKSEPPVLYLDSDRGILSIQQTKLITPAEKAEIYQVPIDDLSADPHYKKPVGFLTVKTVLEELNKHGEYGGLKPKTVVVDSVSTLSEMCMTFVLDQAGKIKGSQPTLPDYGSQMRQLLEIVHLGVGAPCHFICIAHQQFIKDELTGRLWGVPLVTGKFAYNLPNYFDEVYYARVRDQGGKFKYTLLTKPDGIQVAKSRLDLDSEIPTDFTPINTLLKQLRATAQSSMAQAGQKGGGQQAAAQALGINPKP